MNFGHPKETRRLSPGDKVFLSVGTGMSLLLSLQQTESKSGFRRPLTTHHCSSQCWQRSKQLKNPAAKVKNGKSNERGGTDGCGHAWAMLEAMLEVMLEAMVGHVRGCGD